MRSFSGTWMHRRGSSGLALAATRCATSSRVRGNQFAAVVDRVLERVEAADQEGGHAEVVVVEQRIGDLLGRADERGASSTGRRSPAATAVHRRLSRTSPCAAAASRRCAPSLCAGSPRAEAAAPRAGRWCSARMRSARSQAAASVSARIGRNDTLRSARCGRASAASARTRRDQSRAPGRATRPTARRRRHACRRPAIAASERRRSRPGHAAAGSGFTSEKACSKR